jgi:hypothetical protein
MKEQQAYQNSDSIHEHSTFNIQHSTFNIQVVISDFPKNPSSGYSVRNDFTGLLMAALIAWKLTVVSAIRMGTRPPTMNIHQLRGILNG